MEIEGEFLKEFRLYKIGLSGEKIELVADAETPDELIAVAQRRRDRLYAIFNNQKRKFGRARAQEVSVRDKASDANRNA